MATLQQLLDAMDNLSNVEALCLASETLNNLNLANYTHAQLAPLADNIQSCGFKFAPGFQARDRLFLFKNQWTPPVEQDGHQKDADPGVPMNSEPESGSGVSADEQPTSSQNISPVTKRSKRKAKKPVRQDEAVAD
jgi:hypothetical protein